MVLNLPVEDTERLGRPQAPAVYHADPSEHAGGSLHDWFGHTFVECTVTMISATLLLA